MKKYQKFLSEFFYFLVVKFSIYLNRRVFVMGSSGLTITFSLFISEPYYCSVVCVCDFAAGS